MQSLVNFDVGKLIFKNEKEYKKMYQEKKLLFSNM